MAGNNYDQKLRFLPYLPYGYCSKYATTIEGVSNPYAHQLTLGEDPAATMALLDQHRKRLLDRSRYLCQIGYAQDTKRACGTPPEKRNFRHITQAGLAVLIDAPDETIDLMNVNGNFKNINGSIKGNHFRSRSSESCELRELMHAYASDNSKLGQTIFRELLHDAVLAEKITPLTYAIDLIERAKINLDKFSPNQIYNIWRLSHIQAMFQANNHLTFVDRRPYDTRFAIDGIKDIESYEAYVQKQGYTLPAITYYALSHWYSANPGFYRFTQTQPYYSEEYEQEWLTTPAFYRAKELPSANSEPSIIAESNTKGSKQTFNSIHVGLAVGKTVNYACYHAKPGRFRWNPNREKQSQESLAEAVREMKRQNPKNPCNSNVDFALYFCTSHHQFLNFFERTKEKHIKYKKTPQPTDGPYASVHLIPVNDSGTCELYGLLEYGPATFESIIRNNLVGADIGFEYYSDFLYPLTFNGTKVFLGHTMDLFKICHVLDDYLDGFTNFHIICFPDQASWFKQLFPSCTVL